MNNSSSHPPKERVNIAYKSASDGQNEEVELPLKLLVLGDLTGREDSTPIEERSTTRIDKNNFSEVMASYALRTDILVNNTLEGRDKEEQIQASLCFRSLKDFEPDSLCEQIDPLKKLLELREALVALKGPLGNIPNFRRKIDALLKDPESRTKLLDEVSSAENQLPTRQ